MPRTNHRSGPRITIGLPVRNGEPYLAAAIESILGQTMGDLCLVVSDNASTDGTPDIVAEAAAADRRVQALRNTVDLAANPNYNRLLAHVRGPYFKWAAADDIVAPDYLDGVLRLLDRRPDAVLGHSRMRLIDRTGTRPSPGHRPPPARRRASTTRPSPRRPRRAHRRRRGATPPCRPPG